MGEIPQLASQGQFHALQPGQQRHRIAGQQSPPFRRAVESTGVLLPEAVRQETLQGIELQRQGTEAEREGRILRPFSERPRFLPFGRGLIADVITTPIIPGGELRHALLVGVLQPPDAPVHPGSGSEGGEQAEQIRGGVILIRVCLFGGEGIGILRLQAR